MIAFIKTNYAMFGKVNFIFIFFFIFIWTSVSTSPYAVFITSLVISLFMFFIYNNLYKTDISFISLPIKKNVIVLAKYGYLLGFSLLIFIMQFMIINMFALPYPLLYYTHGLKDFLITGCISVIIIAILIPIFHLFKSIYLASIAAICIILLSFFKPIYMYYDLYQKTKNDQADFSLIYFDEIYLHLIESYLPGHYITLIAATILILITSYMLTTYLFKRKDLA